MQISDLAGKLALITGASTGIGAAVAKELARQGAHVALHFNASRGDAEAVAADIRAGGGTVVLVHGDLRKREEPRRVMAAAAEALGGLDILINNAGSLVHRTPFPEVSDALVDEVFDLNARSVIALCQAAVPHME
jgi:3-oxoacyl-[acyl-carrier protein] reductase